MTFRKIDTAGFRPATLQDQPAPQMIWADLADLVIDDRYQRALSAAGRRHIQRIADGWDWKKFQPILVAPTADGGMAVVDGQHRAHAAALVGLTRIPAMTVAMTPSEQARGFAAVNRDRVRLDLPSIYRAEMAAGADWAVRAKAAVEAAGCKLATSPGSSHSKKAGEIYAHGLIRKMVTAGEDEAVTVGLEAIRRSVAGSVGSDAWIGPILSVWLPLLASNQTWLRLPLSAIFDQIDWDTEYDCAKPQARNLGVTSRVIVAGRVKEILRDYRRAAA